MVNIRYVDGIMKRVRIITSLIIIISVSLLISACSPEANGPFNAESSLARLLNEVQYEAVLADASDYAEYAFAGMPDGVEIKMYSCGGGHADAIIMCKANEASDLPGIRDALKEYIASRRHDAERYDPKEVAKYDNAVWFEREFYVIVCITGDTETAEAILSGS